MRHHDLVVVDALDVLDERAVIDTEQLFPYSCSARAASWPSNPVLSNTRGRRPEGRCAAQAPSPTHGSFTRA
jgi:hypothetical protein